jgi:hypothetical protein
VNLAQSIAQSVAQSKAQSQSKKRIDNTYFISLGVTQIIAESGSQSLS